MSSTIQISPYNPMMEEEIFEKLEKSRESATKGNYKSAEAVVSELRGKYELQDCYNIFHELQNYENKMI